MGFGSSSTCIFTVEDILNHVFTDELFQRRANTRFNCLRIHIPWDSIALRDPMLS